MRQSNFHILALCALALVGCDGPQSRATGGTSEDRDKQPSEAVTAPSALPAKVSFNEHVQPILSEYCYHCHGPDSGTREPKDAPLRLDRVEDAFQPRENGQPVIVKGRPDESLIIKLMLSKDPDVVMPPPASHKTMQPEEIEVIRRWIEQGAEYEPHWAFMPVKRPEPPAAGDGWAANPIDRFIAENLTAAGLAPNPPEEPRRFFRRLHLDLTGLPPSPDAVEAFVKKHSADPDAAVSQAADELLASMASAEHFARFWLDAARYADTHGIHIDNYRAIWPYRDWVVRAFHANMPWDRFTTEQIAGDLMPDRTLDQLVATGFSRCLATTGEGGAIDEEYEAIYAQDRVETVSAIWLGLTTSCAACHDHKFDPVSIREFYSLTAFFRNTSMEAMDKNNAEHPPNVFVPLPDDRTRWSELQKEIAALKKQAAERKANARGDFETWLATASVQATREIDSTLSIHLPLAGDAGSIRGTVDGQPREWHANLPLIDAPLGKAPVISGASIDLGDIGSFGRGDRVTYGGFIRFEGKPHGAVIARIDPKQEMRGWDLFLQNGRPGSHVISSWDKAANKAIAKPLDPGKWHHVMVTFNGANSGHQAHAIYINGNAVPIETDLNTVGENIEAKVPLRIGSRANGEYKLRNGKVALQDFRFYRRLLTPAEIKTLSNMATLKHIVALPAGERTKQQNESLFGYYIVHVDGPSREIAASLDSLTAERSRLQTRGSVSLVMDEKTTEPFAHVLNRGVYSDKGERVTPDTPAVLPPMPADMPKNRLGLAKWLNDPANPLPSRVTMNRVWHQVFGTGIVETNDDFGIMGARPSHPQLLDWLAAEFVDSKWDHRHMVRLMVTSATYRQSADVTPEKLERDIDNRLLSRAPRVRLDAEPLRDLALAASGLLSGKSGGPPVKPYQPEGIWEAVAMPQSNTRQYKQDSGEALYRRSIYTFWKRTAPPAAMEIFNAPSREKFCVRRERTNTPLQALALMNDPQFVEASRELAAHAIRESSDVEARADFITLRLLSRTLDKDEHAIVRETLDAVGKTYRENPEEAAKLIATGVSPVPGNIDPPELAAWTIVASQILNLDETVTR
jgi:hypothetical protein